MKIKNLANIIAFSIAGLVVAGVAFGWTNPSATPPGGSGAIAVDTSGNVGIGILAPTAKLDVNGTVKLIGLQMPTGAVNNYVLTSDASGVASWKTIPTVTRGMQMLTYSGSADQYSGTFVVPAGVTQLFVEVYGGGGGGGGKWNGNAGKSSSFSSLSATSGELGGGVSVPGKGGLGGVGSGGTINLKGGAGEHEVVDTYDDSMGTPFHDNYGGNGGSNNRGIGGRGGGKAGGTGEAGNNCGGGGGGGPGGGTGTAYEKAGAGGGAGGVAMGWISVTPGSSISYSIGRGGWGGDTYDSGSSISGGKGCIVVSW